MASSEVLRKRYRWIGSSSYQFAFDGFFESPSISLFNSPFHCEFLSSRRKLFIVKQKSITGSSRTLANINYGYSRALVVASQDIKTLTSINLRPKIRICPSIGGFVAHSLYPSTDENPYQSLASSNITRFNRIPPQRLFFSSWLLSVLYN